MPNQPYPPGHFSFAAFVWSHAHNRYYLIGAFGILIFEFMFFKWLYLFPDFFMDSYSYIYAASAHLTINIWPIGYSWFLAIIHSLTPSDTVLVAAQFFLFQSSLLLILFTLIYFYPVGGMAKIILFAFILVNPLNLYLSNTVSSDALFAALSLFWLSVTIWLIKRPNWHLLLLNAFLIVICFTIRNNAYYYPLVSAIALCFSPRKIIFKLVGILLPMLLFAGFIFWTKNEVYRQTQTRQFSILMGWHQANNALYIYDHIQVDTNTLPTPQARMLKRDMDKWLKSVNPDWLAWELDASEGGYFVMSPTAPLGHYLYHNVAEKVKDTISLIKAWAQASVDFLPFGQSILLHHPIAYVHYFMLPNTIRYLLPPLGNLAIYNMGDDYIAPVARGYFHYTRTNSYHILPFRFQSPLYVYSYFFLALNLIYLLFGAISMVKRKELPIARDYYALFALFSAFLFLNFLFTVVATINILRYQIVPIYVLFFICILFAQHLGFYPPSRLIVLTNPTRSQSPPNAREAALCLPLCPRLVGMIIFLISKFCF